MIREFRSGGRLRRWAGLVPAQPDTKVAVLTVDALLEQVRHGPRWLRLHPNYAAEYLPWLFFERTVDVRRVPLRHLVYDRSGRVAGWYVGRRGYHLLWRRATHSAYSRRTAVER